MNKFIITIDTEGDNLWEWMPGKDITTENTIFIRRFQELCETFGFKPVWLCNWEIIHDERFVEFFGPRVYEKKCEVGMHLHAWNNPPYYKLPEHSKSGPPYLVEYPTEIMEAKIALITEEFIRIFGKRPICHRAGRWAVNNKYLSILKKYGYKVDCSITPGISWKNSVGQTKGFAGPDYTAERRGAHMRQGILEMPLSTLKIHTYNTHPKECGGVVNAGKNIVKTIIKKEKTILFRPDRYNFHELMRFAREYVENDNGYLMFMLHSSEFMPGGSPTFPTEEMIEKLYSDIYRLFEYISRKYECYTIEEYVNKVESRNE